MAVVKCWYVSGQSLPLRSLSYLPPNAHHGKGPKGRFGLEGLACHDKVNVVAAAALWRRRPTDSTRAVTQAARCKILLRVTATFTKCVFCSSKCATARRNGNKCRCLLPPRMATLAKIVLKFRRACDERSANLLRSLPQCRAQTPLNGNESSRRCTARKLAE